LALFGDFTPWMPFSVMSQWPAIDVAEDEKAIVIKADLPGVDAKDVAVEVEHNLLTIRGSRVEDASEKTAEVSRHERQFGRFERKFTLPSYADADKIEAKYEKGTLAITIAKIPGAGPRRIAVQSS
jgi:HSP20 family protein